ncbi:MAG: bifunctional response regulator/alkaline phosphatase family protein [Flavobacteriales bacterium]|nr:bifunctional response regulator/alkaline phosphatase family protein [Flavobacteriales bacterium]
MSRRPHILWADDEIELLKPHIMYLEGKGYDVTGVPDGASAVELLDEHIVDLVFLDENMPGITGLETLQKIKARRPHLPCVMITKSEEEHIMEEAIGGKISDYLIKPLNPVQILSSVKKIFEGRKLVGDQAMSNYQREFRELSMRMGDRLNAADWEEIHARLVHWDLELSETGDQAMLEILSNQRIEANRQFCRFVDDEYADWIREPNNRPTLALDVLPQAVRPLLKDGKKVLFVLIDNFRYDQWKAISGELAGSYRIVSEKMQWSLLPTATQYARNALFAGQTPAKIAAETPHLWKWEDEKGSKNAHEEELLRRQLATWRFEGDWSYHKITDKESGQKLTDNFHRLKNQDFTAVVYNFVDMLSHSRTESSIIKELAADEASFRSITASWFDHSPLKQLLELAAAQGLEVVLTTDHGTIQVEHPVKVNGERDITSNPRYKAGKTINTDGKDVIKLSHPSDFGLPKQHVATSYLFATSRDFMVYPNNFNTFVQKYTGSFQHGGVSMEEMLVPLIHMRGR